MRRAVATLAVLVVLAALVACDRTPPNTDPRRGWVDIPSPDHPGWTIGRKTCDGPRLVYELWAGAGSVIPDATECKP